MERGPIVVVGAGLSGLACAIELHRRGHHYLLLEAGNAPGGRVRTDVVEGFLLDRGFQVLLTAYPECQRLLNYRSLDLRSFTPGSLIYWQRRLNRLIDPWRRPLSLLGTVLSPIGTLGDKLRVGKLRASAMLSRWDSAFTQSDGEITTLEFLQKARFSEGFIDTFFRPFLGGVFLDSQLETTSKMFQFVFSQFSQGDTALPNRGMQAIPDQLADQLSADNIRYQTRVAKVERGEVQMESGERLVASAVVVATDQANANRLLGANEGSSATSRRAEFNRTTCLYYDAPISPIAEPLLVLNGSGSGLANSVAVPSLVAPGYAPVGRHLVSVTIVGDVSADDGAESGLDLASRVQRELESWFGETVKIWRHLRTYDIPEALPCRRAGWQALPTANYGPGIVVTGDHTSYGSIQHALIAGRMAAEIAIAGLGSGR